MAVVPRGSAVIRRYETYHRETLRLVPLSGGRSLAVHGGAARRQTVLRLGDLLVAEGLATQGQVQRALRLQSQSKTYMLLGHILVTQKVVTRSQLLSVERHRRRSKLGELLVKSKALTPDQLETALVEQRRWRQTFGEVVIRLKFVTEEQMRRALCLQLHINYFDLDTIVLDRSLRGLINPRFAKKRLVVPIARVGQTLVVAMDDPTRTAVIDDLKSSTGLDIEVITSTTDSIRRTLGQMYPSLVASSSTETTLPMAADVVERLRQGRTNLEELIRALPHSALRQLRLNAI